MAPLLPLVLQPPLATGAARRAGLPGGQLPLLVRLPAAAGHGEHAELHLAHLCGGLQVRVPLKQAAAAHILGMAYCTRLCVPPLPGCKPTTHSVRWCDCSFALPRALQSHYSGREDVSLAGPGHRHRAGRGAAGGAAALPVWREGRRHQVGADSACNAFTALKRPAFVLQCFHQERRFGAPSACWVHSMPACLTSLPSHPINAACWV